MATPHHLQGHRAGLENRSHAQHGGDPRVYTRDTERATSGVVAVPFKYKYIIIPFRETCSVMSG